MKKKNVVFLVFLTAALNLSASDKPSVLELLGLPAVVNSPLEAEGKAIIDIVFREEQWIVEQIVKSSDSVDKVIAGVKKFEGLTEDKKAAFKNKIDGFVSRCTISIVKPVKRFLGALYDGRSVFGGFVKEAVVRAGLDYETSCLKKFLAINPNEPRERVTNFFEENVSSLEDLSLLGREIVVWFKTFEATYPDAFKRARQFLKEEKERKAKEEAEKSKKKKK